MKRCHHVTKLVVMDFFVASQFQMVFQTRMIHFSSTLISPWTVRVTYRWPTGENVKISASRLNRVHCKAVPQKGFTGNRVVDCTINFEAYRYIGVQSLERQCTATTTITQSANKVVMTPLVEECQKWKNSENRYLNY